MGQAGRGLSQQRRAKATKGLDTAARRLTLAELLLKGGFPEEFLRPIREALGWGLTSMLAFFDELEPGADLPSSRRIQSELVEKDYLPEELAMRLARVRELTEPCGEQQAAPLSTQTAEAMVAAVQSLIDVGQRKSVEWAL